MYELSVRSYFCGAHHLEGYAGHCCNNHGHNWEVEAAVEGDSTGNVGMLIDFKELKEKVRMVLSELDHKDLNTLDFFQGINPSSEHIARHIYRRLEALLEGKGCYVKRVSVRETPDTCATYTETKNKESK